MDNFLEFLVLWQKLKRRPKNLAHFLRKSTPWVLPFPLLLGTERLKSHLNLMYHRTYPTHVDPFFSQNENAITRTIAGGLCRPLTTLL